MERYTFYMENVLHSAAARENEKYDGPILTSHHGEEGSVEFQKDRDLSAPLRQTAKSVPGRPP